MASFQLRVLSCDRLFYEGECEKLLFPACDGNIEILSHHEQLTAQVCVGELKYTVPGNGDWQVVVVTGGIITVENNKATVIVYSAESPAEIDADRAQRAKERAEEELKQKQPALDRQISEDSVARAVQRLKSAGRNT